MADAGEINEVVDTQKVTLTNTTDSQTYKQCISIAVDIDTDMTRRQRTDSVFENLWDLRHAAIEADLLLTTPELAGLVALTAQTNNVPPTKTWTIAMTSVSGATVSIAGSAQLKTLQTRDTGRGMVVQHIRLEFTSTTVTVT